MIDHYVILAMHFKFILSNNLSLSKYPLFIMAMPLNMILVMYVIPYILFLTTYIYIYLSRLYDK